ncbi:MAG: hypothetical protein AAFY99_12930 [Pseudomonadota bacterium]
MYSERHILEFAQSKMLSGFEVAVAILLSSDIESRRPGKILAVGSDKMSCGDDRDFLDVKNQIESVLETGAPMEVWVDQTRFFIMRVG